jgi:hypothetical protein
MTAHLTPPSDPPLDDLIPRLDGLTAALEALQAELGDLRTSSPAGSTTPCVEVVPCGRLSTSGSVLAGDGRTEHPARTTLT